MEDFVKKVLEDPNTFGEFEIISYSEDKFSKQDPKPCYGKARDRTGMTVINWCTEGTAVTYFNKPLAPNISLSIKKDGGTRNAFNAYCFTEQQFRDLLNMTW